MTAVASLPSSHFNRNLSPSRSIISQHLNDRNDLGEGTSSNSNNRTLKTTSNSLQSITSNTPKGSLNDSSNLISARTQLLNPNSNSKLTSHANQKGKLWEEASKKLIEFTEPQLLILGNDIPFEPINKPLLPGQGKGVLIRAMGPKANEEEGSEDDTEQTVEMTTYQESSLNSNENANANGFTKSRQRSNSRPNVSARSSSSHSPTPPIATTWPKLQRLGPGFVNTGNTCFLNATLQALIHTPALAVGLLDRDEHRRDECRLSQTKNFCVLCNMQNLITACLRPHRRERQIKPSLISNHLNRIAPRMRNNRQEDAHEFLRMLIEAMQNAALGGREAQAKQKEKDSTFIYRMFAGKFRSRVTCQHCQTTSDTFDTFLDLSLDIGEVTNVHKALQKLRQLDHLNGSNQYKCEKCKKLRDAKKELSVFIAPPILTLHIKRFNAKGRKINKKIQFTELLDLKAAMNSDSPSTRYKLYAVICHAGNTNHSGHYYAYIKTSDGQWYETDDAMTGTVSRDHVLSANEAYMFFYARDPDDLLEAAIQNNHLTASSTHNSQSNYLRKEQLGNSSFSRIKRKHDRSMNNNSSESSEEFDEPTKKVKINNDQTQVSSKISSDQRTRIIGPMLPTQLNEERSNTSNSELTTIHSSVSNISSEQEKNINENEMIGQIEDLGITVSRTNSINNNNPNQNSVVNHYYNRQTTTNNNNNRKKPKHRILVNGNDRGTQIITHHKLNSVNDLRPKTIRG
ncbi:hypothetical protein CROQUDRAFT_60602 [Cronartium quercuum f. sp. fusiforme G11]|uniref:Ubiquitin carboxyl-terminal hydrolase n=1 Tax=Cronartium quercuum f. sp. fusiforme G11 TaxID=708437 RepID=A0A9P6NMT7_9BASI|nr:hypothetical protein CROQUDRAFT_60602 [Cronartium quercuum f. sp. fusiforme G11]